MLLQIKIHPPQFPFVATCIPSLIEPPPSTNGSLELQNTTWKTCLLLLLLSSLPVTPILLSGLILANIHRQQVQEPATIVSSKTRRR